MAGRAVPEPGLLAQVADRHLARLCDAALPVGDSSTKTDRLVASRFGIFVIETKDDPGWVFGSIKDAMWTPAFGRNKKKIQKLSVGTAGKLAP